MSVGSEVMLAKDTVQWKCCYICVMRQLWRPFRLFDMEMGCLPKDCNKQVKRMTADVYC